MLPLLRKKLSVIVQSSQIKIIESDRGWRKQTREIHLIPYSQNAGDAKWMAFIPQLNEFLKAQRNWFCDVELILADHFFEYALIPWSDELNTREELKSFARIQFTSTYGEIADNWEICLDFAKYCAPRIACAGEKLLLKTVRDFCLSHDVRLTSLQPMLMWSFNHVKACIRGDSILAFVDDDICILLSIRNERWHSIRKVRLDINERSSMVAMLNREIILQNFDDSVGIFVVPRTEFDSSLLEGRINVEILHGAYQSLKLNSEVN